MTETRNRACRGKKQHTRESATDERTRLVSNGAHSAGLVAYDCKFCPHWHVGHRHPRRKR